MKQNMGQGFQTLGQGFVENNPFAQALATIKYKLAGPQPTTTTPPPQAAEAPAVSGGGNPLADYIDNSGVAGVAAMIMDGYASKKASDIAERGPQSKREERFLKSRGYNVPKPMGAQGGAILAGEPDDPRWRSAV